MAPRFVSAWVGASLAVVASLTGASTAWAGANSPTGTLLPPAKSTAPEVGLGAPGEGGPAPKVSKPGASPDGRDPSAPTVIVPVLGPCVSKEAVYAPDGTLIEPAVGGYLFGTGIVDPNGQVSKVVDIRCVGPDEPVAPPPVPPAASDVWEVVPLTGGTIGVNPHERGVTGAVTGLWYTGPHDPQTVGTNIRGYTVTATAAPRLYTWSFGDGAGGTSTTAGRDDPAAGEDSTEWAARHVYESAGDYELSVAIMWSGSYTWAGHGFSGTGNLGSVTVVISRPYRVNAVESVLVGR